MIIKIRLIMFAAAEVCGQILYRVFCGIADRHNFPHDFLSLDHAHGFAQMVAENPAVYRIVAEVDGRIVGSNFLWDQNEIAGVGLITINPDTQASGVGRLLMRTVIERGSKAAGIRLVQDAFNSASLSLYATLGFDIKEPRVLMASAIKGDVLRDIEVRLIGEGDYDACDELCRRVHGFRAPPNCALSHK